MPKTIKEMLDAAAEQRPDSVAIRFKKNRAWNKRLYRQLQFRARQVAEICFELGVRPGDRVALYLESSPEWFEIYYGIVALGAVAVPVDAKLRENEIRHIFHDCGVSVVFASIRNLPLLRELKDGLPSLSAAVLFETDALAPMVQKGGLKCVSYDVRRRQLLSLTAYDRYAPSPDDPASLIYTSGTTGRQKGAVLTHRNFLSNVKSCCKAIEVRSDDNFMLVLPLHHSFAFTTSLLLPAFAQCQVSLVENLKTIKPDMKDCSPSVLLAVPLLLEKMMARMQEGIRKKKAATVLCRVGLSKVVGRKIHRELGGKLRLIISGGAPIDPDVLRAWAKLGFLIVEGYGITETAPVLSFNPPAKPRIGTIGLPLPDVQIRIVDPDESGSGEIATKGPNVMQGYYNNTEATAECLRDGWFYSGDLGFFDKAGYLVINGRKKSLIVNREGKNIYPEEVEQQVCKSSYVLECLALGYREPGETAGERVGLIVVPDQDAFDELETRENRRLSEKEIEETVREEVRRLTAELSNYKRPRQVQIRFDEFEKTTTAKIKRYLYAMDTSRL